MFILVVALTACPCLEIDINHQNMPTDRCLFIQKRRTITFKFTRLGLSELFDWFLDVSEEGIKKTMDLLGSCLYETIEVSGNEVTITDSGSASSNQQVKKGTLGQEVDFTYCSGQTCKVTKHLRVLRFFMLRMMGDLMKNGQRSVITGLCPGRKRL